MTSLRRNPSSTSSSVLRASSRLKSRVLALLEGALEASEMSQVQVAEALGIKKAAVNNTLNGSGNITVETLALYLGAMGFEADLFAVHEGEVLTSMRERRAPRVVELTMRDRDRTNTVRTITIGNHRPDGNLDSSSGWPGVHAAVIRYGDANG